MKIAMIVPGFSADESDWCIPVLVDVIRELSRRVDLHIFALRYPFRSDSYRLHGASVRSLGGADARRFRRLVLGVRALMAIVAEHRRAPFDAVHGVWADEPGFLAVLAGMLLRRPSVVSVMGGELVALPDIAYGGQLNRWSRLLTRFALRRAGVITAASSRDAERAGSVSAASRQRVARLTWGVDRSLFECHDSIPRGRPASDETFTVLHAGSLLPVKDQRTLLTAFRELHQHEPAARLEIAGDGVCRAELESLVSGWGLDTAVTFLGTLRREELMKLYRRCDVFVISSRHEQQPVVALEAALCSRPLIGTDVGILPDLAPAGALVCPAGNPSALAACLLGCRHAPDLRARGQALRQVILDRYLATHTADRLVNIYSGTAIS